MLGLRAASAYLLLKQRRRVDDSGLLIGLSYRLDSGLLTLLQTDFAASAKDNMNYIL